MGQHEIFGIGSFDQLRDILQEKAPKRIFFVTQQELLKVLCVEEKLKEFLRGYEASFFFDVRVNPDVESLKEGVKALRNQQPDIVIGLGGGSVIDSAKAVALLSQQEGVLEDYVLQTRQIEKSSLPIIALPTTAGTGAEATHFAVVYIDKTKYSLSHASMLPAYAIIDPALTFSLPSSITAATGMDAFAQCMESYWSANSTEESKKYAKEGIYLILRNLSLCMNNPTPESRSAMSKAAHLSGKAINIAQTTACHAVSYPMTSYFGIAHGHAVALTLPAMVEFNSNVDETDCADPRGVEYAKKTMREIIETLGCKDTKEAKGKIESLMDQIGLERKLSKLGIATEKDIELIIENGFNPQRMRNNPRKLDEESLRTILKNIF